MSMDLTGNLKEGESIRRCVPWFSIDEFQEVYAQIFDKDLKNVKRGYEHLLMWKARWPLLPPGIEAMFNLIEVILQDKKYEESSDEPYIPQLRLMYATAVMRFLNLVLGMVPGKVEKKTLFHQAKEVGIPKWIVDLRHDSAHGSIMPDIGVLRSAARFCMNWLKGRYWKRALRISDLYVQEGEHVITDHERVVEEVLDCWESFAIYEATGFSSKEQTDNQELWKLVNEIGASLKSKRHKPTHEVEQVDEALAILNQKIKELLRNRVTGVVKQIFIKKMLSGDTLLPSDKMLSLFKAKAANEGLPEELINMWSSVMKILWESRLIPDLLIQLIDLMRDSNDTRPRRRYALLWIHQILKSLIMVQESKKMRDAISTRSANFQLSHVYFERYPDCSYQEQLGYAIKDAIVSLRPELSGAFSWTYLQLPHFVQSAELLRKCLANPPCPDIDIILPSITELMDPPLSADSQDRLNECIRIYSGQENSSKVPVHDKLYSLADVMGLNAGSETPMETDCMEMNADLPSTSFRPVKDTQSDQTSSSVEVPWTRSSEILGWSRCSPGMLPWQYKSQKVWKSFEMKAVWTREGN